MAILKMKRLRLIAVRSEKDALLKELAELGCVEFSELSGEIEGSEIENLVLRESSDVMSCKAKLASLNHAVEVLSKHVPKKKKLLSAKPELHCSELLNDNGIEEALQHAKAIESAEDRIKRASAEESRQRSVIDSLTPWLDMTVPLNLDSTDRCTVFMGSFPARVSLESVTTALEAVTEEAELFKISEDKKATYVTVVCIKEMTSQVQECLRTSGFTPASLSGMDGTAKECKAACESELKKLAAEKDSCEETIRKESENRDAIKLAADKMSTRIAICEAEDRLYGTESVVVMEGWFPAEKELELTALFDRYECAWDSRDPEEDEYPEVPVKLKSNKFTNGLNMVTNMYSLPAYGSVDPNPLMAPFFILFYGLMMADMGYGLLMIIAGLVAMKKIKPRGGALSLCQLLFYGGISTFIMGILTGSFFADFPLRIAQMINPNTTFTGLWHLFDPTKDSVVVMVGAMVLGVIHLNFGMIISFIEKFKHGEKMSAIFYEGALWVMLIGIILFALGGFVLSSAALSMAGKVVLIVGALMLVFGTVREKKGILNMILSVFVLIYNEVTGWFGDILSYTRIMALMLAGSVIGTVFNTIASITGNPVTFILIFVLGHTLNFGLNLLGCYVHDLRLQCLEFFGKFYSDGGRAFAPLAVNTKYYNTTEE